MPQIHVLYHSPCPDGLAAAAAAYLKFGEGAIYTPVNYSGVNSAGKDKLDVLFDIPLDSDVYILDFSYPLDVLTALAVRCNRVLVLDHHKTAYEDLKDIPDFYNPPKDGVPGNLWAHFNMEKSGAVLAWEFFQGRPLPTMYKLIQDRDLWRWELPDTKAFSAYFHATAETIQDAVSIYYLMESSNWAMVVNAGRAIVRMEDKLVRTMADGAFMVGAFGYSVPCTYAPVIHSEVGHRLLDKFPDAPFVITLRNTANGVHFSLRSRAGFDVSELARTYGGGGHNQAASFYVTLAEMDHFFPAVEGLLTLAD